MSDWQCWTCSKKKNISLDVKMQILVRRELARKRSRDLGCRVTSHWALMEEAVWLCEGLQKQHCRLEGWPMLEDARATGQEWPQRRRAIAHAQQGLGCSGSNDHHGSARAFISRRELINPQGKLRIWEHCAYVESLSRVRLWNPMDCMSPASSAHGIFQARILGQVAISSSRGSSQLRDRTHISSVSCIGRQIFSTEPPGKLIGTLLKYLNIFKFKCKHLCSHVHLFL